MINNIVSGIMIGIANIIPGVSGGTVMVILGVFDDIMKAIANLFKKENMKYLFQITIGIIIGLLGFAKIIEFLFENYPTQTIYWFIGLIIFSIPLLVKHELKDIKLSKGYLLLGILIIFTISLFAPATTDIVVDIFPTVTILYLLKMILLGFIAGAATIFPGISGSMLLLILGEYYLYKSYLANATSLGSNIIVPLLFITIGIIIGVIMSAKITTYLLNKFKDKTMSLILGLIVMSSIVLIPIKEVNYNLSMILTSIGAFLFGGVIIYIIEKLKTRKKKKSV